MSGDDHSPAYTPGGTAFHFDRFEAREPAGLCRRPLGVRALDVLHFSEQRAHARAGRRLHLRRLRSRVPPADRRRARRPFDAVAVIQRTSTRNSGSSRPTTTSIPAPSTSRTHCVYWPDWASRQDRGHPRDPDGRQLLPLSRQLDRVEARVPERRRLPDALRRHRRLTHRRLPGEHQHHRRVEPAAAGDYQHAARQRARPARLLRRLRDQHAHRFSDPEHGRGRDRRVGAGARRADHLLQAATPPGPTARRLDHPSLNWSAGTLTFVTTVGSGATGLQAMLPPRARAGTLSEVDGAGLAVPYTVQTIKGIEYAMFDAITGTCHATYPSPPSVFSPSLGRGSAA